MLKSVNFSRIAWALLATNLAILAFSYGRFNGFLIDQTGKPLLIEYMGVHAAGELVVEGNPAGAYDWAVHSARQRAISRQTDDGYYPWGYPPPYLFVAGALALMPYLVSIFAWILSTLAFQVWTTVAICGTSRAVLWVLAASPTYINASVAHTGFLIAGLIGIGVHLLISSPITAGVALGLLAFKPQFGLLLPVALVAGGYWRTIFAAILTIVLMTAASVIAFGIEPWQAFPGQLERIADTFRTGRVNFAMLISVYGFGRTLGLGHAAALVPQALVSLAAAAMVFRLWRGDDAFALKAAGLVAASLLASPYLFPYDLPVLVVVVAFLYRAAGAKAFDGFEIAVVAGAGTMVLFSLHAPFPVGFVANVAVAGLVLRRWRLAPARASACGHRMLPPLAA